MGAGVDTGVDAGVGAGVGARRSVRGTFPKAKFKAFEAQTRSGRLWSDHSDCQATPTCESKNLLGPPTKTVSSKSATAVPRRQKHITPWLRSQKKY